MRQWWPFLLLLVAAASRWLVAESLPDAAPSLGSAAAGCAWAALLAFTLSSRQTETRASLTSSSAAQGLVAGAMLLGGPAIGLLLDARGLSAGALTIALALTPVAVAVAVSAIGSGHPEGIAGRLWPGLAAVAGLLLILVEPNLSDLRSDAALVLAPVLTGLGAVLFLRAPQRALSTATALLGAAALFSLAAIASAVAAARRPALSLPAVAYEGVLAYLSILALSRVGATRWASQFTWLPLFILLQGILLVRPPLTARWLTGLALLAGASVYLLLPGSDDLDAPVAALDSSSSSTT